MIRTNQKTTALQIMIRPSAGRGVRGQAFPMASTKTTKITTATTSAHTPGHINFGDPHTEVKDFLGAPCPSDMARLHQDGMLFRESTTTPNNAAFHQQPCHFLF